jgi:hypothetical protein
MRRLLDGISNQVQFDEIIEKPENFENGLVVKLLARFDTSADSKDFDETKWKSTYNAADLKPDVITKELNDMFTYSSSEDQWKYNVNFQTSGKVGFLDVLSGEAKADGAYTNEELKKRLDQQHIHAEFEGHKIVAKSVDVQQVNLSDVNQENDFISVKTFLGPNQEFRAAGAVEVNRVVALHTVYPDLTAQVAALYDDTVPVGTIQAFCGTLEETNALQPKGWWVCDGRAISDPLAGKFKSTTTPNLQGLFLRGSTHAGDQSGNEKVTVKGQDIVSTVSGWDDAHRRNWDPKLVVIGDTWRIGSPIQSTGHVNDQDISTLPPYRTVIYILKVRSSNPVQTTLKPLVSSTAIGTR